MRTHLRSATRLILLCLSLTSYTYSAAAQNKVSETSRTTTQLSAKEETKNHLSFLKSQDQTKINQALRAEMIPLAKVRIRALDKITARTETFELKIGDVAEFGALTITGKACRKSAPLESPESAAFLQVWELPTNVKTEDIITDAELRFSGWMFASSPGLSAMDHPIYDIWVLECLEEKTDQSETDSGKKLSSSGVREGEESSNENSIEDLDLLEAVHSETLKKR